MKTARTTIRLLREFSSKEPELGVSELARRLDLDKATVHRLLRALHAERVVEQNPETKRYRLGLAVLDLAAARLRNFQFLAHAAREIEELRDAVGESVGLHVRDGHEMVCLEFAEAAQPVRVTFFIGERSPVHLTSGGRVALANLGREEGRALLDRSMAAYRDGANGGLKAYAATLARAAEDGYAIADESYERGVRAIAVPVPGPHRELVCTICVAAPAQRRTLADLRKMAPKLADTAHRISRNIMGRQQGAIVQRLGLGSS
jgi:DNA-binding IclR family transcriptional regulator